MGDAGHGCHSLRELAYRAQDGLEVVLFWNRLTSELTVTVSDERTGAYFEVDAPKDAALDVFNHPYSYAALQGLPYDDALLASWAYAAAQPSCAAAHPLGQDDL